jgi:hypothetical protein
VQYHNTIVQYHSAVPQYSSTLILVPTYRVIQVKWPSFQPPGLSYSQHTESVIPLLHTALCSCTGSATGTVNCMVWWQDRGFTPPPSHKYCTGKTHLTYTRQDLLHWAERENVHTQAPQTPTHSKERVARPYVPKHWSTKYHPSFYAHTEHVGGTVPRLQVVKGFSEHVTTYVGKRKGTTHAQ